VTPRIGDRGLFGMISIAIIWLGSFALLLEIVARAPLLDD
jgi:hypothetical protein